MTALLLAVLLAAPTPLREYPVQPQSCYDGDTCDVTIFLGLDIVLSGVTLRLCDIDTPEIRISDQREAAIKARDWLLQKLKDADVVTIKVPQKTTRYCSLGKARYSNNYVFPGADTSCDKRGKYGRLLAYLVADGVNLNHEMVKLGLAKSYAQQCTTGE